MGDEAHEMRASDPLLRSSETIQVPELEAAAVTQSIDLPESVGSAEVEVSTSHRRRSKETIAAVSFDHLANLSGSMEVDNDAEEFQPRDHPVLPQPPRSAGSSSFLEAQAE